MRFGQRIRLAAPDERPRQRGGAIDDGSQPAVFNLVTHLDASPRRGRGCLERGERPEHGFDSYARVARRVRADAAFALSALKRSVIFKTRDKRDSMGLTIVLPRSPEAVPDRYSAKAFAFTKNTRWEHFLNRYRAKAPALSGAEDRDWAEYNNTVKTASNAYVIGRGGGLELGHLTLARNDALRARLEI